MSTRKTRKYRKRTRRSRRKYRQSGGSELGTAVIIEPRAAKQAALEFVIRNVVDNLPTNWNVLIFHGVENKEATTKFLETLSDTEKSRVSTKDIGLTNMDTNAYNSLMMSDRLLDAIPTELFLIIQTDSMICSPGKGLLENFVKYDYVGAPWRGQEGEKAVGNGGFSLRRKSVMRKLVEKCDKDGKNEDGFFAAGCEGAVAKRPPPEEAEKFSVETIFKGKQPFAIHNAWHYLRDKTDALDGMCPGYKKLVELNT
jgi:hypothetical protein